jgi:hypothetical protein
MKIISIKVELTQQECRDVLTTAIESNAIQYWACEYGSIEIKRDSESNIYEAKFTADNALNQKINYTVTAKTIQAGVDKLLELNESGRWREMILNEDIDSDCADSIIQYALFGELVYG